MEQIGPNKWRFISPDQDTNIITIANNRPTFRMNKWKGEAYFDMVFPIAFTDPDLVDEKVTWTSPYFDILFYEHAITAQMEYGGLEFEILLKQKPPANSWAIPIKTQNLHFSYQPALTQTEINEGAFRPDNVVGSYAAYHVLKQGNVYKAGKAFHLFRPKAVDAIGTIEWCDIEISNSTLKFTIPQQFLNKATYPVQIDPTFGRTDIGGSSQGVSTAYKYAGYYQTTTGGTVTSISFYGSPVGAETLAFALYEDASQFPDALNEAGSLESITPTDGWYTQTGFSATIAATTYYWIAFRCSTSISYYYDSNSNNLAYKTPATYDDPWGTTSRTGRTVSIYATYTEAPPPPPAGVTRSLRRRYRPAFKPRITKRR